MNPTPSPELLAVEHLARAKYLAWSFARDFPGFGNEAVSEALLTLWQAARRWEPRDDEDEFGIYLYACVRGAVRGLRADARRQSEAIAGWLSGAESPDDIAWRQELGARVRELVRRLPSDQRDAIRRRFGIEGTPGRRAVTRTERGKGAPRRREAIERAALDGLRRMWLARAKGEVTP